MYIYIYIEVYIYIYIYIYIKHLEAYLDRCPIDTQLS